MIRAWVLLTCHPTSQFIFLSQSYSMAQMLILDSILIGTTLSLLIYNQIYLSYVYGHEYS